MSEMPTHVLLRHARSSPKELLPFLSTYRRFGFSGSRERCFQEDKDVVFDLVDVLPQGSLVVSGQCTSSKVVTRKDPVTGKDSAIKLVNENTDRWSVSRAASMGLETKEYPPVYAELPEITERVGRGLADPRSVIWYITKVNYARNVDIVDSSDVLFALVPKEIVAKGGNKMKKSGSWHTVKYALSVGKPVYVNLKGEKGWILLSKGMMNVDTSLW